MASNLRNHEATAHSPAILAKIRKVRVGESLSEQQKVYKSAYRRLDPSKPSPTVTRSGYRDFIHPVEDRTLTVRELACLQTFPLDWEFMGMRANTYSSKRAVSLTQFGQVGNAVPPVLAEALGKELVMQFFSSATLAPTNKTSQELMRQYESELVKRHTAKDGRR